MLYKN